MPEIDTCVVTRETTIVYIRDVAALLEGWQKVDDVQQFHVWCGDDVLDLDKKVGDYPVSTASFKSQVGPEYTQGSAIDPGVHVFPRECAGTRGAVSTGHRIRDFCLACRSVTF